METTGIIGVMGPVCFGYIRVYYYNNGLSGILANEMETTGLIQGLGFRYIILYNGESNGNLN